MTELDPQWRRVEIPEIGLAFGFPHRTPSGQAVALDDVRLHARSEDTTEVYFEISRQLHVTPTVWYQQERDNLVARHGAEVTALSAGSFNGLPAHEFSASFGSTVRTFALVEHQGWLFRIVHDPRSPLNLLVLETIRLD